MMQTLYQLPQSLSEDLNKFRHEVERFDRGETSAAEFRAFRVPRGVYEQRESGSC
jgi:sulfite reductase (ferredoxin)